MGFRNVKGTDAVLPEPPPLVGPPLSLLDLARTLIDDQGDVAELREATEKASSAQEQVAALRDRMEGLGLNDIGTGDATPEDLDAAQRALEAAMKNAADTDEWIKDVKLRMAAVERWEHGFQYLPELPLTATEVFTPDSRIAEANLAPTATNLKAVGNNQTPFAWYDPFEVEARDERSLFPPRYATGFDERGRRANRAGRAHEAWQCEQEFWGGLKIPTNYHLTASPSTATSTPHRDIDAWPNPTAAPGTVLGTPVGLAQALQALDQAVAEADAGIGMIHATPYTVQAWMRVFPFIRDNTGRVFTVNMNLIVPGFGYPGTGPDVASRTVVDGVLNSTTTISSATANFTTADIGSSVTDDDGEIPAGAFIVSVPDGTHAVLNVAATVAEGAATLTIGASRSRLGGFGLEWAFATDLVYKCRGDVQQYADGYEQGSPDVVVDNEVAVRSERPWAFITNRLLRAAVLIDTTTV